MAALARMRVWAVAALMASAALMAVAALAAARPVAAAEPCFERGPYRQVVNTSGPDFALKVSETALTFSWTTQTKQVLTTTREWDLPPARVCDGDVVGINLRGTGGTEFGVSPYVSTSTAVGDLNTWANQSPILNKYDTTLRTFVNYPGPYRPVFFPGALYSGTTPQGVALPTVTPRFLMPSLASVSTLHLGIYGNDGGSQLAMVYWTYTRAAATADLLGAEWTELEGVQSPTEWQGVWTRRGTSNTFDARWTNTAGAAPTGLLTMTLSGSAVTIQRQSGTSSCTYQGTIAGPAASGTYTCTNVSGSFPWSASIRGAGTPAPTAAPPPPTPTPVPQPAAAPTPRPAATAAATPVPLPGTNLPPYRCTITGPDPWYGFIAQALDPFDAKLRFARDRALGLPSGAYPGAPPDDSLPTTDALYGFTVDFSGQGSDVFIAADADVRKLQEDAGAILGSPLQSYDGRIFTLMQAFAIASEALEPPVAGQPPKLLFPSVAGLQPSMAQTVADYIRAGSDDQLQIFNQGVVDFTQQVIDDLTARGCTRG